MLMQYFDTAQLVFGEIVDRLESKTVIGWERLIGLPARSQDKHLVLPDVGRPMPKRAKFETLAGGR